MQSEKRTFAEAIVEGKRLAIRQNRPVLVGYSWRNCVWFVDTDCWHSDVRVNPTHLVGLTSTGRRAMEAV